MSEAERIKRAMEECGLSLSVLEIDGDICYTGRPAEGKRTTLTKYKDHDEDEEWTCWYLHNEETGNEGELETLDEALSALEQEFASTIIANLRERNEWLEGEVHIYETVGQHGCDCSQKDACYFARRAETAEKRVAELEAENARLTNNGNVIGELKERLSMTPSEVAAYLFGLSERLAIRDDLASRITYHLAHALEVRANA